MKLTADQFEQACARRLRADVEARRKELNAGESAQGSIRATASGDEEPLQSPVFLLSMTTTLSGGDK